MIDRLVRAVHDPHFRLLFAVGLLLYTLIGWPLTHVLILLTAPPELSSWAGHLLLAISWQAITFTAVDILATCDVRREQDDS